MDDPRLPQDVLAMSVGKREDWVDEFNWQYWCYYKEDDAEYDENQSKVANAVRYASKKAWDKTSKTTPDPMAHESRSKESSEKGKLIRQRIKLDGGGIESGRKWESKDNGFRTDITIIEAGWSLNGHYYSKEIVGQIAELANKQAVGYSRHGETFDRDPITEWVMVIEKAWKDEKKAKGSIYIFSEPNGAALKERIEKYPQLFGVSIDAYVKAEEGEVGGRDGLVIKEVVALNSVDIVMMPAAGGAFDGNVEEGTKIPINPSSSEGKNTMDVKELKESHPAVAELLIREGEDKAKEQLNGKLSELQGQHDELVKEHAAAKAKLDEIDANVKAGEFKAAISEKVNTLPEHLRTDAFTKILMDLGKDKMDTIDQLVQERKESGAKAIVPVVEGQGPKTPDLKPAVEPVAEVDLLAKFKKK